MKYLKILERKHRLLFGQAGVFFQTFLICR